MKILVATDDTTFNVALSGEYVRRGFDVHVGCVNLFLKQQHFDLIHCHWPEELVGWQTPPEPHRVRRVIECLDFWRKSAAVVCSVHNLLPHAASDNDVVTYRYYEEFLLRMHHIGHFSQTSMDEVIATYPSVPIERHFVHGLNTFPEIAAKSPGREAARAQFGLKPDEFVLGTFGQLRTFGEVELIQSAVDQIRDVRPTILFAGRLPFAWRGRRSALRRWRYKLWKRRHNVVTLSGYLDDGETAAFFEAIDALIIPRFGRHLNSGLLPLAMTFGTPVVAPDYGVYREVLAGSGNGLYEPANASKLARAIEKLSLTSCALARQHNRKLFKQWGCGGIVDNIIETTRKACAHCQSRTAPH